MAHYRIGDQLYDVDPTTWPNVEVSAVQRALGCSMQKFMDRLEGMDVDAMQAMIWTFRKRTEPGLRIDAVTFTVREYMESIETSDQDIREIWPMLTTEQRPSFVEQLDAEQRDRLFVDGELIGEVEAVPLDPSPDIAISES